jgi:hypothetical protein
MPRIGGVIATLALAALSPAAGFAQSEFAGVWVSEHAYTLNVTTLGPDGSFRTESFAGIERIASTEGRWERRGNALKWTYLNPPVDIDDVNPIVAMTHDRFTLKELDGSESTFFRKGIDPQSPSLLPIGVGTGWVFDDRGAELVIRVSTRATMGGRDCYRVDWIAGRDIVQSEYWHVADEGVTVVGRRVGRFPVVLPQPYLLLKRVAATGDTWSTGFIVGLVNGAAASATVGPRQEIETPAGRLTAVRVTTSAPQVVI